MKNIFHIAQTLFFISSLIYGGLGGQNFTFITIILLWFTMTFLVLVFNKKNIRYPPGFYIYMIFLIFFALNLFWTKNFWSTYWYLLIFSGGFFFWIIAYNLKNEFRHFDKLIIFIGVFFGVLAIVNHLKTPLLIDSFSLHKMATVDHHHIADLWSVILLVISIKLLSEKKFKLVWFALIPFGGYFIYFSKSRTALISLIAGIFYLVQNYNPVKKYFKVFLLLIFLATLIFFIFAKSKPTIPNRGYYLQGIAGIIRHPLGIGVGNFGVLSADPKNHLFGFSGYSSVGMNILMEIFAGMGFFGIIFLIWFIKVLTSVLKNNDEETIIPKVIFLVLIINFIFDFAYLIPTMLWLWFIGLVLSQK